MDQPQHKYLKRLPPEYYQRQAFIHWSMTIDERQAGWLDSDFYHQFRELLTHTAFRWFVLPHFCLMPDHMHLLWLGVADDCDQRKAMRYFRKHLNPLLEKRGFRLQRQAYDHVLRDLERERPGFDDVFEYIARNPERAQLVPPECYREYRFTACLIPGSPELKLWQADFHEQFWRIYTFLQTHGLSVYSPHPKRNSIESR